MSTVSLDQVFIIDPACSFHDIAYAIAQLGWQRDALELSPPLLPGEPEVATWSWAGNKPFITYTFNPVVHMRVLEVATLPPALRSLLAAKLPLLDHSAIAKLFDSSDARERLLGLWCAQETEKVDLLNRARQLTLDTEPILAEQAQEVCERLERINTARKELLVQMNMMAEAAPALIRRMNDRAFVQSLKPSREDLQQLFDEYLLAAAESAVETIYADPDLCLEHLTPEIRIEVIASPAGLLRWPNLLSDKFPGGYCDIAGWMNPKRIWMCWKLLGPSGTTVSYDGLVWLDNKWLWLPKIFRYLSPFLFSQSLTKH